MKTLLAVLCVLVLLLVFNRPVLAFPLAVAFTAGFLAAVVAGEAVITAVRKLFIGR